MSEVWESNVLERKKETQDVKVRNDARKTRTVARPLTRVRGTTVNRNQNDGTSTDTRRKEMVGAERLRLLRISDMARFAFERS